MSSHHQNSLQTAVRWAGNALLIGSVLALFYHGLVAVMHVFVPADKSRKALAKRLRCDPLVVAEGLAAWTICFLLVALMWAFVAVFVYAVLFG